MPIRGRLDLAGAPRYDGRSAEVRRYVSRASEAARHVVDGCPNATPTPSPPAQALELKVGRAWAIKDGLRTLWTYRQPAAVRRFFDHWYAWAIRSRLEPVKKSPA